MIFSSTVLLDLEFEHTIIIVRMRSLLGENWKFYVETELEFEMIPKHVAKTLGRNGTK